VRAVVLNDTRRGSFARHLGCNAVMEHLLHLCAENGIEVVRTFREPEVFESREFFDALRDVDAVIANGEGTMHHDNRHAQCLSRALLRASQCGKRTALINTVWQGNRIVNECVGAIDFICARDSWSARELREAGRADVAVAPDLSLLQMSSTELGLNGARGGTLFVDSVDLALTRRLHAFAAANGARFRNMQEWTRREELGSETFATCDLLKAEDLARARVLIGGRFHAICLALKQGLPFLGARSNTHKLEALLHDAGVPLEEFFLPRDWETTPLEELETRAHDAHTKYAAQFQAFPVRADETIRASFTAMTKALEETNVTRGPARAAAPRMKRRVRVCYFNTWAGALESAPQYVSRAPTLDLRKLVTRPDDRELMRKARLDCDWYAENARCFAAMTHDDVEFLPAFVAGVMGVLDFAKLPREPGEERWLITMGHQPQSFGANAGKVFALLAKVGVRHCYYAFDEASRFMPCFGEIAPYLDLLIHDELPLEDANRKKLKAACRTLHRSWVANVAPFSLPFNEAPEDKILFLGSQLGLTPHRQRQIDFLRRRFKDRFVAISDHSIAVGERASLNRFKVGLCPEGRKFVTLAMAQTHTDRPFWSGCVGMAVVSEDSQAGGRLQALHEQGLILRYAHGDLEELEQQCERALAMSREDRRLVYEHFNRHETIGAVVAEAMAVS
jgi:hypothetical protein